MIVRDLVRLKPQRTGAAMSALNQFRLFTFWMLVVAVLGCVATTGSADEPSTTARIEKSWPPKWLQGLWFNETVTLTVNNQPVDNPFVCSTYHLFHSGFEFSVYKSRLSVRPMIGRTSKRGVEHCLFKMTNDRPAMRTEFTLQDDWVQYVSYLFIEREDKRYRFNRRIVRKKIDRATLALIRETLEKSFFCPHCDPAEPRRIFEAWLAEQEASLESPSGGDLPEPLKFILP